MQRTLRLLLVVPFLALGAGSVSAGEIVHEPPKARLTPEITGDQILTRVAYLASDELEGRETGTDAGRLAEEYVAGEMTRFGLEPLSATAKSPFTEVPVPGRAVSEQSWIEVLGADGTPQRIGAELGASPFSFSRAGDAEGEVVFAGFGISAADQGYDDYAGTDVKGKIVLVLRHGPGENDEKSPWHDPRKRMNELSFSAKAERAVKAGAAGILLVNDCNHKEDALPVEAPGEPSSIPVFAIRRATADFLLTSTGKTLAELQTAIDADRKARSAPLGVVVRAHATVTEARGRNVVFVKRGTDEKLKDEAVLVCAHMDHVGHGFFGSVSNSVGQIHNGADDNASGTAALLEVAEAMAAGAPTKRTLIFAGWCAEEKGLIGSEYFAEHPLWDLGKIALCVNMDMVGRYRATAVSDVGLFAEGAPSAVGTEESIKRCAAAHELRCTTASWESWEQSDHFSFYRKGVPSLFLHTGLHDDYHRPSDKWWKTIAEPEARIAQMVVDLTRETADAATRPTFAKKPPRPVLGVGLADADGRGAKLMEVLPGLGANVAGLQPNDVITGFAGKPVKAAADLTALIQTCKEGDFVDVTYVRGTESKTVKVRISGR